MRCTYYISYEVCTKFLYGDPFISVHIWTPCSESLARVLSLRLRIQEAAGSILGSETGYSD
jgi:hypothetical protein